MANWYHNKKEHLYLMSPVTYINIRPSIYQTTCMRFACER